MFPWIFFVDLVYVTSVKSVSQWPKFGRSSFFARNPFFDLSPTRFCTNLRFEPSAQMLRAAPSQGGDPLGWIGRENLSNLALTVARLRQRANIPSQGFPDNLTNLSPSESWGRVVLELCQETLLKENTCWKRYVFCSWSPVLYLKSKLFCTILT
jgi:hypothetical protein